MPGRIGTFGALMLRVDRDILSDAKITAGHITEAICNRRMFSIGSVEIGSYRITKARLFWDTGSKQTFVYVPSFDVIDIAPIGTFPVSGIGAEVKARAYASRIALSENLSFDNLIVGVMIGNDTADDDSYESADVIIGMDVIQNGVLIVDGPGRTFTFEINKQSGI